VSRLLLAALLNGILVGTVYALLGMGLNLIYGVMRVVNFAHGDLMVLASYGAFWVFAAWGFGPVASLGLSVVPSFLLGVGLYRVIVPRLLRARNPEIASFLAFFGVSLMLSSGMLILWGATPRGIPYPYEGLLPISVALGGIHLPTSRLIAASVAAVSVVLLAAFLYGSYAGKAIRAIIQNRAATQILGINTGRLSALTFGLGLILVGVAGVLATLLFPAIAPSLGEQYTLVAFAVIVLGGLGRPLGAVAGGIVFGLAESVSGTLLPVDFAPAIAFLILIAVIMIRPEGLLAGAGLDQGLARLAARARRPMAFRIPQATAEPRAKPE
jgi:branched-chain amino acid transport system permease protein